MSVRIIQGDCRAMLATLPDASVHACITSPPYFNLRDYGTATWDGGDPDCDHLESKLSRTAASAASSTLGGGKEQTHRSHTFGAVCGRCGARRIDAQIGLESSPDAYIAEMVAVFGEVRRVLRDDGTLWLNLGDSYNSGTQFNHGRSTGLGAINDRHTEAHADSWGGHRPLIAGAKPKDLLMMPARVALALQSDGWWLRSDTIWAKSNPMPESVSGSHYSRHMITIADYERLFGVPYPAERSVEQGAGDLSDVQAREISSGKEAISKEREGEANGQTARGTAGCEEETPRFRCVATREAESGQIREDAERNSKACSTISSPPIYSEGQGYERSLPSEHKGQTLKEAGPQSGEQHLPQNGQGQGSQTTGARKAHRRNSSNGKPANGIGVAGNPTSSQGQMLLLPVEEKVDAGSHNPAFQGRAAHEDECCPSMSAVQLEEEQPIDYDRLVECPGCDKCSATDGYILHMSAGRPTSSHEHVFLLTKSARYFFDADAVREPQDTLNPTHPSYRAIVQPGRGSPNGVARNNLERQQFGVNPGVDVKVLDPRGRNIRNVWTIATAPFPEAHFATFPPELAERCIKAGTSERGCCANCGAPWVRQTESDNATRSRLAGIGVDCSEGTAGRAGSVVSRTTGWLASCQCNAAVVPCVVSDPFFGAGTTGLVSSRLGRDCVGIELNREYAAMATKRIEADAGLFSYVTQGQQDASPQTPAGVPANALPLFEALGSQDHHSAYPCRNGEQASLLELGHE